MMWVRLGVKYPIAFSPSRQALYHREVIDRASSRSFGRDPATANLIDEMLKNHEVPLALIDDLKDYSAYLKIQRVYHLVISGRMKEAGELLGLIGPNRRYYSQILRWRLLSLMPYSLINLVRTVRLKSRKP